MTQPTAGRRDVLYTYIACNHAARVLYIASD